MRSVLAPGYETRTVHCLTDPLETKPRCPQGARPPETRPCVGERGCRGEWFAGEWGGGVQGGVVCRRVYIYIIIIFNITIIFISSDRGSSRLPSKNKKALVRRRCYIATTE